VLLDARAAFFGDELRDELVAAVASARTLRGWVRDPARAARDWQRFTLAPPDAAALIDDRRARVLPRWSLAEQQRHFGLIPVRTQLADVLPERHDDGPVLVRRGARWTASVEDHDRLWHDGREVPNRTVVELRDGDRIDYYQSNAGQGDYVFVARDVDAACQARFTR
jgi:hypothetical protein